MKPEDAVVLFLGAGKRPWTDFEVAPVKASRQLHVNAQDVARGRMIDEWAAEQARVKAVSDHLEARKRKPLVPYGQTMKPETLPPSDAPSMTAWDGPQQWKGPTIPEAMTGGALMGGLGMMGGALGRAAWKPLLAMDVGNAAHAVTSKLTGHQENAVSPYDFKYGMRLPETLLGYGDSPEAGVGELMGFFSGVSPLRALERPIAAGIRSMKPRVPESNRLEYWKDVPQFADGGLAKAAQWALPALTKAWAPSVVKPKGGQWLAGSVENALSGLKTGLPADAVRAVRNIRPELSEAEALAFINSPPTEEGRTKAINNWVEGPLTKYVKTRMASPEDEVRRLADEGVLHFTPDWVPEAGLSRGMARGITAGNFGSQKGKSQLARDWEDITDQHLNQGRVEDFLYDQRTPYILGNEWMKKVDPKTPVYGMPPEVPTNLGFDHLVDELKNALDPNSGLPRHLMLTPDAVKNMSMEKAVRRVADINTWRAAQQAEANQQIAGGPGQALIREYPHSDTAPNPKGLRWVELKADDPDPAMYTLREAKLHDGSAHYEYVDKSGEPVASAGKTPEEALKNLKDTKGEAALRAQLKYEGDTMGHCVGGYCDDVIRGHSRIFSLRDAKGEPHVTVEVNPIPADAGFSGEQVDSIRPGLWNEYLAQQKNVENGVDGLHAYVKAKYPEVYEQLQRPSILQIKGKQNRKPNDEYLPFVQDFVKNPPIEGAKQWGDVGDLQNSGLRKVGSKYVTPEEHTMILDRRLPDGRPILDQEGVDAMEAMQRHIEDQDPNRFAQGGSVHAPDVVKQFLSVQL